jgi:hypothetical protein
MYAVIKNITGIEQAFGSLQLHGVLVGLALGQVFQIVGHVVRVVGIASALGIEVLPFHCVALGITVGLQLLTKKDLIAIFVGTISYMFLIQVIFV